MPQETTYSRIVALATELTLIANHNNNSVSFDADLTDTINSLNNIKKYF